MTTHADLTEVSDQRIVADWTLGQWADRLLEQAGIGVTIVDRHGEVMYYNKWADEHLDRQPAYLGHSVHERHRRKITNPRFDAMLKLFVDGRIEPVRYVARPYGKTTLLVTVSPIRIDGELVGLSQLVLLKTKCRNCVHVSMPRAASRSNARCCPTATRTRDGRGGLRSLPFLFLLCAIRCKWIRGAACTVARSERFRRAG